MSHPPARRLLPVVALALSCLVAVTSTPHVLGQEQPAKAKIESVVERETGKAHGQLNDTVVVKVANHPKEKDVTKWVLHLDGVPLSGRHPVNSNFASSGELVFDLKRLDGDGSVSQANKDAWAKLLCGQKASRPVPVAVGPADKVAEDIEPLAADSPKHFTLVARAAIVSVVVLNPAKKDDKTPEVEKATGSFNDTVVVKIANHPKGKDVKKWVLHLNRIPLKGQHPVNKDFATSGELVFDLKWPEKDKAGYAENKAAWVKLLGGLEDSRVVDVAVGADDAVDADIDPLDADDDKHFTLDTRPGWRLFSYAVFLVVLLTAIVLLALTSNLLRDPGLKAPKDGSCQVVNFFGLEFNKRRPPYSLALTQMAFWFFLVVGGYMYIGLITHNFIGTISAPILILLGISAGTGLAAVLIDSGKDGKRRELAQEQREKALYYQTLEGQKATATDAEKERISNEQHSTSARTAEIEATLITLPSEEAVSEGLFQDLIRDADGVSLHRFQIVIWTLVLGVVFVVQVIHDLSMPEFDTVLLTLMGISAGTYLGFKFPEKKTLPDDEKKTPPPAKSQPVPPVTAPVQPTPTAPTTAQPPVNTPGG